MRKKDIYEVARGPIFPSESPRQMIMNLPIGPLRIEGEE